MKPNQSRILQSALGAITLLCGLMLSVPAYAAGGADCNARLTSLQQQGGCATSAECGDTTKFQDLSQLDCESGYVCCAQRTSSQSVSPTPTSAPTAGGSKSTRLGNPLCGRDTDGSFKDCDFADVDIISVMNRIITTFLGFAGSIGLLAFVWGGMMYMTSGGSKDRAEKGMKVIKTAVIGLLIIVFAYLITNVYLDLIIPSAPTPQ